MRLDQLPAGRHSGGVLVNAALETVGVTHTFGIPGTHNIELYDALERGAVQPVLVTDEQSAGFMADGMSRSGGALGCVNVVPGAGLTHVLSGVGEAYMDNVPMLVLICGIRIDTGHRFQLHDVDQLAVVRPLCKATLSVQRGEDIPATILKAAALAQSGCPGPVVVEIPGNHYIFRHRYDPKDFAHVSADVDDTPQCPPEAIALAARILDASERPLVHLGMGATGAADLIVPLVERLGAVVSTTFSGKGVFPESHPQWLWPGFGTACPPPLRRIAAGCDAALVIGARMGEVSTGSYGLRLPDPSIQVDIDADVIGANFPVSLAVEADARKFVAALGQALTSRRRDVGDLVGQLDRAHDRVRKMQMQPSDTNRVSPDALLRAIQAQFPPTTRYTTDSGKGTFLAVEHLRLDAPGHLLSPTDYSCMGYALPAAIGAAFAHPEDPVVALAGDGALLMTGLELLTATQHGLPLAVFVLRDGELGQISRFQRDITNRPTCTILPDYDLSALAAVAGVECLVLRRESAVSEVVAAALQRVRAGHSIVVDVAIDYSRKTWFTRGVIKTNFGRLPWRDRLRMVSRVVGRRVGL